MHAGKDARAPAITGSILEEVLLLPVLYI